MNGTDKVTTTLQNDHQVMAVFARTFAHTTLDAEEFFRREFPNHPICDRLRRDIRKSLLKHLASALAEVREIPATQEIQIRNRMDAWAVAFVCTWDEALEEANSEREQ